MSPSFESTLLLLCSIGTWHGHGMDIARHAPFHIPYTHHRSTTLSREKAGSGPVGGGL